MQRRSIISCATAFGTSVTSPLAFFPPVGFGAGFAVTFDLAAETAFAAGLAFVAGAGFAATFVDFTADFAVIFVGFAFVGFAFSGLAADAFGLAFADVAFFITNTLKKFSAYAEVRKICVLSLAFFRFLLRSNLFRPLRLDDVGAELD